MAPRYKTAPLSALTRTAGASDTSTSSTSPLTVSASTEPLSRLALTPPETDWRNTLPFPPPTVTLPLIELQSAPPAALVSWTSPLTALRAAAPPMASAVVSPLMLWAWEALSASILTWSWFQLITVMSPEMLLMSTLPSLASATVLSNFSSYFSLATAKEKISNREPTSHPVLFIRRLVILFLLLFMRFKELFLSCPGRLIAPPPSFPPGNSTSPGPTSEGKPGPSGCRGLA